MLRTWNTFFAAADFGICYAEAFKLTGGLVAQDTGHEPHNRVDDHRGRQLAAAQNVVADGKLHVAVELVDALVDTLIASADQHDALKFSEFARYRLRKWPSLC